MSHFYMPKDTKKKKVFDMSKMNNQDEDDNDDSSQNSKNKRKRDTNHLDKIVKIKDEKNKNDSIKLKTRFKMIDNINKKLGLSFGDSDEESDMNYLEQSTSGDDESSSESRKKRMKSVLRTFGKNVIKDEGQLNEIVNLEKKKHQLLEELQNNKTVAFILYLHEQCGKKIDLYKPLEIDDSSLDLHNKKSVFSNYRALQKFSKEIKIYSDNKKMNIIEKFLDQPIFTREIQFDTTILTHTNNTLTELSEASHKDPGEILNSIINNVYLRSLFASYVGIIYNIQKKSSFTVRNPPQYVLLNLNNILRTIHRKLSSMDENKNKNKQEKQRTF